MTVAGDEVVCHQAGDAIVVSGVLHQAGIAAFRSQLLQAWRSGAVSRLELGNFDVDDAASVLAVVEVVRQLAAERPVTLRGAPQLIGHTLYRVGALGDDASITLEAMREDEPYG